MLKIGYIIDMYPKLIENNWKQRNSVLEDHSQYASQRPDFDQKMLKVFFGIWGELMKPVLVKVGKSKKSGICKSWNAYIIICTERVSWWIE